MAIKKKTKSKTNGKAKLVGDYDTVTIYYGNDEYWTFKLSEWELYRDFDWIEIVKKDGTLMESFCVSNTIRLSFSMDKMKGVEPINTDVLVLKGEPVTLKPIA